MLIITAHVTSATASLCASEECRLACASVVGFTLLHWRNDDQEGAVKTHEVGQQGRLRKQGHELSSARQYEVRLLPVNDLSSWILTVALTVGACKILQMGKSVLVYALISFTHCLGTTVTEKETIFSMNQKLGVRSNYPLADRDTLLQSWSPSTDTVNSLPRFLSAVLTLWHSGLWLEPPHAEMFPQFEEFYI